jgi:hypothetical protein
MMMTEPLRQKPPSRRTALAGLLLAGLALAPQAARAIEARVPSPGGGTLVLTVPDGWRHVSKPGRTPTVAFKPPADEAFLVLVSTFLPRTGPSTPQAVRQLMENALAQARPQAEEGAKLALQDLSGASVHGFYFSATDKAPKPGEYKYLIQGAFLVRGMPAVFTILTNEDSRYAAGLALLMFSTARRD